MASVKSQRVASVFCTPVIVMVRPIAGATQDMRAAVPMPAPFLRLQHGFQHHTTTARILVQVSLAINFTSRTTILSPRTPIWLGDEPRSFYILPQTASKARCGTTTRFATFFLSSLRKGDLAAAVPAILWTCKDAMAHVQVDLHSVNNISTSGTRRVRVALQILIRLDWFTVAPKQLHRVPFMAQNDFLYSMTS